VTRSSNSADCLGTPACMRMYVCVCECMCVYMRVRMCAFVCMCVHV